MILAHLIRAWRGWRRYRAGLHELSALTDMELADVGVPRSSIHWVAWQTRFGDADSDGYDCGR